jgi:hypothetical protein
MHVLPWRNEMSAKDASRLNADASSLDQRTAGVLPTV